MRTAVAIGLWIGLGVLAALAVLAALPALLLQRWGYAKDIGGAMDRLGAAGLGWGGEHTVSAECGSRRKDCRFCRVVCRVLDWVQPGHCAGAAEHENLH